MARAVLCVFILANCVFVSNAAHGQDRSSLLKNTRITPVVLDMSKKFSNTSNAKIKVQELKIERDTDFNSILKEKQIIPNADSYSMVYRLNPKISDLSKIPTGTKISVPTISSKDATGYQFELQIDRDIKDSIESKLNATLGLQTQVQNVALSSPENSGTEEEFKNALQKFLTLSKKTYDLTVGTEKKQPVTRSFVEQVNEDIHAANEITSKALSSKTISSQDIKTLESLTKDLEIKNAGLDQIAGVGVLPEPATQAELTINLMEQTPRVRSVYPYRVHYATISGYRRNEDHKFRKLAQSVSENLERGNYFIWAVRDLDGKKVTYGVQEVPVRPPKTQTDITVIDTP